MLGYIARITARSKMGNYFFVLLIGANLLEKVLLVKQGSNFVVADSQQPCQTQLQNSF